MFDKRAKKVAKTVWTVVSILIIVSMLLFFAPGLIPASPAQSTTASY